MSISITIDMIVATVVFELLLQYCTIVNDFFFIKVQIMGEIEFKNAGFFHNNTVYKYDLIHLCCLITINYSVPLSLFHFT